MSLLSTPKKHKNVQTPLTLLLIITLDAFGTLYRPRHPIPTQYLSLAKSHNLHLDNNATTNQQFSQNFKSAFRHHSHHSPNYGRGSTTTTSMNSEQWWANVVRDTFKPLLRSRPGEEEKVPESLAKSLFERFSGRVGYELFDDVVPFLRGVRAWERGVNRGWGRGRGRGRGAGSGSGTGTGARMEMGVEKVEAKVGVEVKVKVVIGVLTNSDPRVAGVLRSLGLRVGGGGGEGEAEGGGGPGQQKQTQTQTPNLEGEEENDLDIDFVLTSYEIGHEKPSPIVFEEAERLARRRRRTTLGQPPIPQLGVGQGHRRESIKEEGPEEEEPEGVGSDAETVKVHIGDDLHKDYWGAIRAGKGWDAILLDRAGELGVEAEKEGPKPTYRHENVRRVGSLTDAVGVVINLLQQRRQQQQQSRR